MSYVSGIAFGLQIIQPDPTSIAGSGLNANFRIIANSIASGNAIASSGINQVFDDKTPQLGGPLDVGTGSTLSQPIFNYAGGPVIFGGEPGTFLAAAGQEVYNYNQGNYCVNLQFTESGYAYDTMYGCYGTRCAIVGGHLNQIGSPAYQTTSTFYDSIVGGSGNQIGQDVTSACIAGGERNICSGDTSFIAAGKQNYIGPNASNSFVGGYGGFARYPSMQAFGISPLDSGRGGFQRIMFGQWGDFSTPSGVLDFYGYQPTYSDEVRFYRPRQNTLSYLNLNVVATCSGDQVTPNALYHYWSPIYAVFTNRSGNLSFNGGESWYGNISHKTWFSDVGGPFNAELMLEASGEYLVVHTRSVGTVGLYTNNFRTGMIAQGMEINLYNLDIIAGIVSPSSYFQDCL